MSRRARRRAAFTLIELMAVITVMGLIAAVVYPQLSWSRDRSVRSEAEALAETLEYARQRAVVTGRVHRVRLDFDASWHALEWLPPITERPGEAEPELLPLEAPPPPEESFEPVPNRAGRGHATPDGILLLGIESEARELAGGEVTLRFEPDGRADAARIWVGDAAGDSVYVVELEEFAEAVGVTDDAA
jgi:prepilin-type N-terminal cleavage/methylation domain-containing protein